MANNKGSRLRHVGSIVRATRHFSSVYLRECGHRYITTRLLQVGMRVFCKECRRP